MSVLPDFATTDRTDYAIAHANWLLEQLGPAPELDAPFLEGVPLEEQGELAQHIKKELSAADLLEPADTNGLLSATTSTSTEAQRNLPFLTAREIADQTPEDVRWWSRPWLPCGCIVEVVGKVKAAGKTTWITHCCRALLDGLPFLGVPTERTPIVYLTEQPPSSFREVLRRADLLERDDFVVLYWRETVGVPWPDVVAIAAAECKRRNAGVLVIDTLGRFAGLRGDAENNAGDADRAMEPLQMVAADGLTVVVLRDERKGGGEVGESGRGSSAFAGAVDIVLAIRRGEGNTRSTVRVVHGLSRFDETPETLVVELTDAGYVALGDESQVALREAREAIMAELSDEPAAIKELQLRLPTVKRTTLQKALDDLTAEGAATRTGAGKRGDPYRFISAALSTEVPADRNGERP